MNKKIILFLIFLLLIIIGILIVNINLKDTTIIKDDSSNTISNNRDNYLNINNYSLIVINGTIKGTQNTYKAIYILDENNIVITTKYIVNYESKDDAQKDYENRLNSNSMHDNVLINNNIVSSNTNFANGITKDDLLEKFSNDEEIEIEIY